RPRSLGPRARSARVLSGARSARRRALPVARGAELRRAQSRGHARVDFPGAPAHPPGERFRVLPMIDPALATVEMPLASYVPARRWFRGKARTVATCALQDAIPIDGDAQVWLGIVKVEYGAGHPEHYALPLAILDAARAAPIREHRPHFIVCDLP